MLHISADSVVGGTTTDDGDDDSGAGLEVNPVGETTDSTFASLDGSCEYVEGSIKLEDETGSLIEVVIDEAEYE